MPKPSTLTPREIEILANATRYSVVVKGSRTEHSTIAAAQAAGAEAAALSNRGAALYAIGEVCGVEASALIATYKPGTGWVHMQPGTN